MDNLCKMVYISNDGNLVYGKTYGIIKGTYFNEERLDENYFKRLVIAYDNERNSYMSEYGNFVKIEVYRNNIIDYIIDAK